MSFDNFKTYGDSPKDAFETLCSQLFERYLRRTYGNRLIKFRVINGAGGDGGIEAYGELDNGDLVAVQAKWFWEVIKAPQIKQIKDSVETALKLRKNIVEYIICVPRSPGSLKFGRGAKGASKKPVKDTEEIAIDQLSDDLKKAYLTTKVTWWFEQDLELQINEADNEGVHKFWFGRELISMAHLIRQFDLEKLAWLEKRYIPELHGQGVIQSEIQQVLFSQSYRKELLEQLNAGMRTFRNASELINRFEGTLAVGNTLKNELNVLQIEIDHNLAQLTLLSQAIAEGISILPSVTFTSRLVTDELLNAIELVSPTDRQLGVKERLLNTLVQVRRADLEQVASDLLKHANQTGRLFLGNSGTGKTHALSNTVDIRLHKEVSPAIIIRAKGTPCSDWTQILNKALDLNGWDRGEILSALETLAIRTDRRDARKITAGEELKQELAKVIICIDGLEEDIAHWPEWYERMRESVGLMKLYPRVRFIYTARTYFLKEEEIPKDAGFKVIEIPAEGDVPVASVVDRYFSPEHFNIDVKPKSLIRGIDSLYALRLFCELYQNQVLTSDSDILTIERDLLNEKVNRIESDFRKIKDAGTTRKPIGEAIGALSELFYEKAEIEHNELFDLLYKGPISYFEKDDIDKLIDYLVNNGFLIKSELPIGKGMLARVKTIYNLTYQSIMELIMSEKYADAIISGESTALPAHLLVTSSIFTREYTEPALVNERIVQLVVNKVFHESNKLIGRDGFLIEGVNPSVIEQIQLKALIMAPPSVGETYRENIDELFFRNHESRHFVFSSLIYPSAASAANYFGAEYLHELLMEQPTPFEREKIWLGWDRLDIHQLGEKHSTRFYRYDLCNVIDPYGEGELHLPEFALHNEYPLIYGWALSTLNQPLRARLRAALTEWAVRQPEEYNLLLQKLFHCNDPQIQEDLAAITLGVASKLKDSESLRGLAQWALQNVFAKQEIHRNVIVRTGFRAIVEKAFNIGAIDEQEVKKARPQPAQEFIFIPVDQPALTQGGEQIYPVVHDLAWYVIKRAFDDFLKYYSVEAGKEPNNPGEAFLKAYLDDLELTSLSSYSWTISAAIAYMKILGFSRQEGNHYTDASHGSKSKHFTLEEKYTWLAVHFIQGYLSDHLPLEENGKYVDDYMKITNIDNPAELLEIIPHHESPDIENNWIIKEPLAPEMMNEGTPDDQIKNAVESEPVINFDKWLEFKDNEFRTGGSEDQWLALFNYTTVHDSRAYISSSVDVRGVIIEKGQAPALLDIVRNHPSRSHFVTSIDGMVGSPDTDTYSNPSDVVWMSWIDDIYSSEHYYLPPHGEEKLMQYTVTSVTKDTVEGENEIYIPSKLVRTLMGINEMNQQLFLNSDGNVKALNHILIRPNYDRQEMTLVPKKEFLEQLEKNDLQIVWFVDLYRAKNALNEAIKSDNHPMKTRKYMVWYENGIIVHEKFWDERFSNQRDEDPAEPEDEPEGWDYLSKYDDNLPDLRPDEWKDETGNEPEEDK